MSCAINSTVIRARIEDDLGFRKAQNSVCPVLSVDLAQLRDKLNAEQIGRSVLPRFGQRGLQIRNLVLYPTELQDRDFRLGGSEELTFIFYNVPSFLSGAHICLVIRNLRMNNGAI